LVSGDGLYSEQSNLLVFTSHFVSCTAGSFGADFLTGVWNPNNVFKGQRTPTGVPLGGGAIHFFTETNVPVAGVNNMSTAEGVFQFATEHCWFIGNSVLWNSKKDKTPNGFDIFLVWCIFKLGMQAC
jgi:hypothetical protein